MLLRQAAFLVVVVVAIVAILVVVGAVVVVVDAVVVVRRLPRARRPIDRAWLSSPLLFMLHSGRSRV